MEIRSNTPMLKGSYYDANIKERKEQVNSFELSSNKQD
jgi:hypothetical protein